MLGIQACGLFFGSEGTDGCSTSISPSAIATLVFTGSGDAAFKTYDTNKTNNDQLVPLGPKDLTGPAQGSTSATVPPVSFYDGTAESLTVSCTATLTAPDGTSLSVSAKAPQITVFKPTATWGIDTGYVQQFQYPDQSGQYHDMMGLLGPPNVAKQGQSWHDVIVTVPTPFTGGTFAFVQLSTPDRKIYRHATQTGLSDHFQYPDNGKQGLDNGFTFLNKSWAIPQTGSGELTGDSPSQGVPDTVTANDGGGSDWYQVTASDQFTTWLMYRPSGGVWVPLQKYSWSWSGTMTKGTAGWSLQSSSPTSAATQSASVTDNPPSWNLTHTNNEPFVAPN